MGTTVNTAGGIPQFKGGPDIQHWSFRVKMHPDSVGVLKNLTQNAPEVTAEEGQVRRSGPEGEAGNSKFHGQRMFGGHPAEVDGQGAAIDATFTTKCSKAAQPTKA